LTPFKDQIVDNYRVSWCIYSMSDTRNCRIAGRVYSLSYHLVWCPKNRRKVLVGEIADELRWLLSSPEAGFGLFRQMLEYKAEGAGTQVIAVKSPQITQACSGCGSVVPKGWSVRVHVCPDCGLVLDRDVNAACQILSLAVNNLLERSGQAVTCPVGGALPEKPLPSGSGERHGPILYPPRCSCALVDG